MPMNNGFDITTSRFKHHKTLEQEITSTGPLRERSKTKKRKAEKEDADQEGYVSSKLSRKILKIGQDLVEEDSLLESSQRKPANTAFAFDSRIGDRLVEQGEENDDENEDAWGDEDEDQIEDTEVDPGDLQLFNKFLPPQGEEPTLDLEGTSSDVNTSNGINLADLILDQIAAHEAAQAGAPLPIGSAVQEDAVEIPAKVIEVYSKVGLILSRYKSGRLPKVFKILPTLENWEEIVSITRPESWTPNACYEACRIFVSSNQKVAERFMGSIILDRVREDIHESKKLNVHLYRALQKSLYRPKAFFKGFLFPLITGSCTLREAQIVSSVVTRCSIPPLHASAALMKLTDIAASQASMHTEGGGATNILIRAILEKRYALPWKVIDNLVFHFMRFRARDPAENDAMTGVVEPVLKDHKLPLLWHKCLLAFAQRYRDDITEDQREALLDLLLSKGHKDIGPEVRRELLQGRGRGVAIEPTINLDTGDDTMLVDTVA